MACKLVRRPHVIEEPRTGEVDAWMDIQVPDAIHEFPFAPEGAIQQLVGRDAITAYMRRLAERIRFGTLGDVSVREVRNEIIIEATSPARPG